MGVLVAVAGGFRTHGNRIIFSAGIPLHVPTTFRKRLRLRPKLTNIGVYAFGHQLEGRVEYPERMAFLSALGVADLEERLYGIVLDHPGRPAEEIAEAGTVSCRQAERLLRSLEDKGLVTRSAEPPRGFLPAPPDAAIGLLILRRQEELDRLRIATAQFVQRFRRGRAIGTADLVEVIIGHAAVAERFRQLRAAATEELLFFDRAPYAVPHDESIAGELDLLARGVAVRCLYEHSVLEMPGEVAAIGELMVAGEQARTIDNLPTKLVICDRRVALMPLNADRPNLDTAIVVQESTLLNALTVLFERLWQDAAPLGPTGAPNDRPQDLSEFDRRILSLLAAGLTEHLIAQQFNVSPRTVGRRIERMMAQVRAQSRFQLALRAARRQWVETA